MQVEVKNKDLFPDAVRELLHALYTVGFFEESMLIGSWVMSLYQEEFGINYVLRTLDIDFAVKFVHRDKNIKIDLEKVITDLRYIPVIMQSGIRRFSRENFTIEFVVQRKGERDEEVIPIRKWNITAFLLPFVEILLRFPFTADFGKFKVRAPLPEAFFIHKLIVAQRRPGESKKDKDLEQCSAIARKIDIDRLHGVIGSLKLSKKVIKTLRASCEEINIPLQMLGLK